MCSSPGKAPLPSAMAPSASKDPMLLDLRAGRACTPQAPSPIRVTQKVLQSEAGLGKTVSEGKASSVCLWLPPLPVKYLLPAITQPGWWAVVKGNVHVHERVWEREHWFVFSYRRDINSSSAAVFQVVSFLAKQMPFPPSRSFLQSNYSLKLRRVTKA